jgi:DHA1 family tetracycline resistance protein-like MFS transporter
MIFGLTFAWAVRDDAALHMPGLPIFIAAGLLLCAFLLAVRVGHAPASVATAAAE